MEILKKLRTARKLTQQAMGDALGISRQAYSNYETGKREPNLDTLQKLAGVFGVSADVLLGNGVPEPKRAYPLAADCVVLDEVPQVPIFGKIAAGVPILARENIIGYQPAEGIRNPEEYFYLQVRGDSMVGAGIPDGALVLIHKQDCTEDGQIVACLVNGDSATLKRFKRVGDTVVLMPENSSYQPILVQCSDFDNGCAKILGVAEEVITRRKL